jgi:hypothetical protein
VVERHRDDVGLEALERHDRAHVGRAFNRDRVAGIEECLPEQLQRLDRAAGHHQPALLGPRV